MSQNMSRDSMVYASEEAPSPAPAPLQQVVIGETIPDIDMKIRESEFKMKGELIQLRNKVLKLERDVGLCCPDYDKLASKIQSRVRGMKDRTEMTQKYPEVFNKVTKGWIVIKDAQDGIWNHGRTGGMENGMHGIETMKEKTNFGFWACPKHQNYTGGLVENNKDLEEILNIYIKMGSNRKQYAWLCDFHVAPGVSFYLILQKIKEGFEIEFEDEGERLAMDTLMGKHRGGKKRSKKKRSKKKRSKKKRSKKYSRRNIKSNRKNKNKR